jgi:hypothetical protein
LLDEVVLKGPLLYLGIQINGIAELLHELKEFFVVAPRLNVTPTIVQPIDLQLLIRLIQSEQYQP